MKIAGVIPVRYQSSRFPGKALVDIRGKSMVQRVYEQASKTTGLADVIVATDHQKILDHVRSFGGNVCMTSESHPSGTDRCREAIQKEGTKYDFVINIQGDEPFIEPEQIQELIDCLHSEVQIATQAKQIEEHSVLIDPNCVKVIFSDNGNAIYFSRTPIPFMKNNPLDQWLEHHRYFQHIGIYAYRTDVLEEITELPVSTLERMEGLEQLRWLENGFQIKVLETKFQAHGIDTPEDLEKALAEQD